MDNNEQKNESSSCGPDCTCNSNKGMSARTKTIILAIIVITAGLVLGNSLLRKSPSTVSALQQTEYSGALSKVPAAAVHSQDTAQDSATTAKPPAKAVSIAPLASFESLNTVAQDVDGVFILLVNSEAQKTPAMQQEIAAAMKTIAARGVRMSAFQLAATAPEFAEMTSQMPVPGVLAVFKGRGMRGVQGQNITETKLLQACLAAMQPTSCCPAGGKRVCK